MKKMLVAGLGAAILFLAGCGNETSEAKQGSGPTANGEGCLTKKIKQFRKQNGEEAILNFQTLSEFRSDCGLPSDDDADEKPSGSGNKAPQQASTEPTVKVKVYSKQMAAPLGQVTVPFVSITATDNNVVINGLVVNRGNCEVSNPYVEVDYKIKVFEFPIKMKFGEKHDFRINKCQEVIEFQVDTNSGKFGFKVN